VDYKIKNFRDLWIMFRSCLKRDILNKSGEKRVHHGSVSTGSIEETNSIRTGGSGRQVLIFIR